MFEVDENVTRSEKVSFAEVAGFDAGLDRVPLRGVLRPEVGGVGRWATNAVWLELSSFLELLDGAESGSAIALLVRGGGSNEDHS